MAFMRANKKEIYHAAIYLRLSRDDEGKKESDSIHNQRELLKSYIESHPDIKLYGEYSDDGYTGTNFDRPGFQKMMDLVQKNVIDCIIVKDLSRLGRNYIETGRYIDQIFPMLGVRFISINDNYDSASESNEADEIIIPFKNLINDAYCRDISMKVRSQLDTKRKNGKFVGSFAAYGYKKDPNDVNKLIVDDKAAEVVKMIFNLRLEGYSPGRIADKLNNMGIASPLQYKRSSGTNFVCSYLSSDNPRWHHGNVKNVFEKEQETPNALVLFIYNAPMKANLKNLLAVDILEQVLTSLYTQTVREDEGGAYSVGVNSNISDYPEETGIVQIYLPTAPDKLARMTEVVNNGIAQILKDGPAAEEVDKAKQYLIRSHAEKLKNNGYWMNQLKNIVRENKNYVDSYEETVNAITIEDIKAVAKIILNSGNRIEVGMTSPLEK